MMSMSLVSLLAVLVLVNPVLSKFVPMTTANKPDRLKEALKFDNGRIFVESDAEFDVEPERGGYEFLFDSSCRRDTNIHLGSYFLPIDKAVLKNVTGVRNLVISTGDGSVSGSVKVKKPSAKLAKGRVLLDMNFVSCQVELVRGTPVVDLSDRQLIGGLTKLQFALIIVLPVAGTGLLITVMFLIVKRVQKMKKGQGEKREKVKQLE